MSYEPLAEALEPREIVADIQTTMKSERVAKFEKTRRELESTRGAGDIARLLSARLCFTQADLSAATGAQWPTVRGWLGPEGQPPEGNEHRQRLDQLKALVILILEDGTIAEDLVEWFRDPARNLGYRTPFELIGKGQWKQVGSSLCEEIGVPKAVRPQAFRSADENKNSFHATFPIADFASTAHEELKRKRRGKGGKA